MPSGPQLERLVRRLDRQLNTLEADAIRRLDTALLRALRRLEDEVRAAYAASLAETATAGVALREARARVLLEQVRALLDVTSSAQAGTILTTLNVGAYEAGIESALSVLSLYQQQVVGLSAVVRVEAAARATNAAARLARHGREFAERAEQHIISGIIRGQGWSKTARELRRETGVTRRQAERIVRTESLTASDEARRAAYVENGVEYVQRMATMDSRVCGWCAMRAGNVYRADEAPAALHPNDRCYNAPWKPEWQELGLTDDQWFREHREEAKRKAREAGETLHTGPAPFERAEGREPPKPVWTP
jgi:SPP1 gp7 family putative phage head morphogenesis protein